MNIISTIMNYFDSEMYKNIKKCSLIVGTLQEPNTFWLLLIILRTYSSLLYISQKLVIFGTLLYTVMTDNTF